MGAITQYTKCVLVILLVGTVWAFPKDPPESTTEPEPADGSSTTEETEIIVASTEISVPKNKKKNDPAAELTATVQKLLGLGGSGSGSKKKAGSSSPVAVPELPDTSKTAGGTGGLTTLLKPLELLKLDTSKGKGKGKTTERPTTESTIEDGDVTEEMSTEKPAEPKGRAVGAGDEDDEETTPRPRGSGSGSKKKKTGSSTVSVPELPGTSKTTGGTEGLMKLLDPFGLLNRAKSKGKGKTTERPTTESTIEDEDVTEEMSTTEKPEKPKGRAVAVGDEDFEVVTEIETIEVTTIIYEDEETTQAPEDQKPYLQVVLDDTLFAIGSPDVKAEDVKPSPMIVKTAKTGSSLQGKSKIPTLPELPLTKIGISRQLDKTRAFFPHGK